MTAARSKLALELRRLKTPVVIVNFMLRVKLVLIVHFLSLCVVSAVPSGEHEGLSQGSSTF